MKVFHPLCGFSLQKGAKYIAIADLIICILGLTFRLVVYDYQEYQEFEIETEFYSPLTNETSAEDHTTANGTIIFPDVDYQNHVANVTAHLIEILRQSSNSIENEYNEHYVAIFMVKMVIVAVIYIVYICLEVWLCRLLLRASKNRDGGACKTWFWFRLLITIFFLIVSIVGIATLKHDWVDWVLEPLNIYRLYELFVVNEFKREIAATSGRVKLRA